MPLKPPRRCLRCGTLTRRADYCPAHRPRHRAAYNDPAYRAKQETARNLTGSRCPQCQRFTSEQNPMTVDHITPLARGGTNAPSNLRYVCRTCNTRKGART